MKEWRCKTCGVTYTPNPPDYACPECGSAMRCGYLVETNTPLMLLTLGEGIYWTPGEAGLLGERVALKAYACPGCGYIGLYARRMEKQQALIENNGN